VEIRNLDEQPWLLCVDNGHSSSIASSGFGVAPLTRRAQRALRGDFSFGGQPVIPHVAGRKAALLCPEVCAQADLMVALAVAELGAQWSILSGLFGLGAARLRGMLAAFRDILWRTLVDYYGGHHDFFLQRSAVAQLKLSQ
jgi:hypothetical protein